MRKQPEVSSVDVNADRPCQDALGVRAVDTAAKEYSPPTSFSLRVIAEIHMATIGSTSRRQLISPLLQSHG